VTEDDLLFEGLKVLDVGTWIAGPVAATMLADRGAEVIKVEAPVIGDGYRLYGPAPFTPNAEVNYTWALDARNKRSISLNLKSDDGMNILKRLIADCDVYVTNQPLPLRRLLKLNFDDISPLNERMIYASLTPYGELGPDRDREAFDLIAYWGRSGLMDFMRHPGLEPIQAMAGMGDHPTAIALYAAIVTALLKRERTGKGTKVHTSLMANGVWSAACLAQASLANADFSSMPGQRLTTALYQASDGRWLQLNMIRTVEDFDRLLLGLDAIDLLTDKRYSTPEARLENAAELTQKLRDIIATRNSDEWLQLLRVDLELPVERVATFDDLSTDVHAHLNKIVVEPVDDVGISHVIRDPVNVDGVGLRGVRKAPELGEHTSEILDEMGFSPEDVESLRENGVV